MNDRIAESRQVLATDDRYEVSLQPSGDVHVTAFISGTRNPPSIEPFNASQDLDARQRSRHARAHARIRASE
jgi:hypothetical protein